MIKVQTAKSIDLPAAEVWEVIADYRGVHHYSAAVASVDIIGEKDRGVGATRQCHFHDDTSVTEKITDWQEGKNYTVQLSDFSMPLKEAVATISVRETGATSCEASFAMEFTPKFGPLGWVMGQVMMKPMMRRVFGEVLAGLAHYATTGEEIGEGWKASTGESGAVPAHGS